MAKEVRYLLFHGNSCINITPACLLEIPEEKL
jgi:hypothetical protein